MKPKDIMNNKIFLFCLLTIFISMPAVALDKGMDSLLDGIYRFSLRQDAMKDSLGDYSFIQKVLFTKLDGDDTIEEKSIREFRVYMRGDGQASRELISAKDMEEGQWVDVTEMERSKKKDDSESRSQKFSLTEMVGPDVRNDYRFVDAGMEWIADQQTIHLSVAPIKADEEKFSGDLWVDENTMALVAAKLIPSEMPTGVDQMVMSFEMQKVEELWLPKKVFFDAAISFLFIFEGRIISEITFDDYRFNNVFPDSVFSPVN
ncbi:MAG: hypothetical protein E4H13_10760 [Calditrichales bacterium]|nr:MAG: hypothetical protein E4H13_10760 [Calditrichales bacterium]